ncbi:serine/threonine kinase [Aureococcus anophagefferens]|nr:serine/threonine kinase [Aureococcus anophagefferens]
MLPDCRPDSTPLNDDGCSSKIARDGCGRFERGGARLDRASAGQRALRHAERRQPGLQAARPAQALAQAVYCLYAFREDDGREVAALRASAGHPFVVALRHSFVAGGVTYAVLEHHGADGGLWEHLRHQGPLEERRAALYAAEIASALDHVHARGFVLRGLCPEAVSLDVLGHATLSSFQLAAPVDGESRSRAVGVPEYRAPEMVRQLPYGVGIDRWALGVLVFEMLAGHAPFLGGSREELETLILKGVVDYEDMTATRRQRVSGDARDLVAALTRLEPAARPALRDLALRFFGGLDWDALPSRPIVDDVHLSDAASLEAVRRLGRPAEETWLPDDVLGHVASFLRLGPARPALRDPE